MLAARLYAPGDLRIETVDRPGAPAAGSVRLAVTAAGICGSDLHNYRTGRWIGRSPSTPGHELTGTVEAIGEGVDGFAPGDAVVADSRVWCGTCPACSAGRRNLCHDLGFVGEVCDGGFAEAVTLPARLLVRVDKALDPAVAVMAEPLAVALHVARRLRPPAGAPVLVAGCGPIGGLTALVLADAGHPVAILDRNAARRELVAAVTGAVPVGGDPAAVEAALGARPLHAVDATGSLAIVEAILEVLAGGGTLALVGISHGRLPLDPNGLVEREISLVGCSAFADELTGAVERLPGLAARIRRLVDAEIAIPDIPAAYARLLEGRSAGLKTVVRPRPDGAEGFRS